MSACAGRNQCGVVVQAASWAVPTESGVQSQPGLLNSSLWVPAGLSADERSLATFWLLDVLSPPPCGLDASREPQLRAGCQGSIFSVLGLECSVFTGFPALVPRKHLSPSPSLRSLPRAPGLFGIITWNLNLILVSEACVSSKLAPPQEHPFPRLSSGGHEHKYASVAFGHCCQESSGSAGPGTSHPASSVTYDLQEEGAVSTLR